MASRQFRGGRAGALLSTAHALGSLTLLGAVLTASAQPAARPAATAQSAQGPASTITPISIPEIAQRAEQG